MRSAKPSRARFEDYQAMRASDPTWASRGTDEKGTRPDKYKRQRSFVALFAQFWSLTASGRRGAWAGHRPAIYLGLATLSFVTIIGLAIPASTKVAIDYVLTDDPGPAGMPPGLRGVIGGLTREQMLWALGAGVVALAVVGASIGTVGRWQMTRVTKRVQADLRRRAFEHAVRLPMHRIHQHKSGGMASLLREDAGLAGELLFSMVYNPWRAVVQLVGTLAILAWVDWRMLAGGLMLVPVMWLTQRTWIGRIRPLYRDAKHVRQNIDAAATEVFGGMRVVRGFSRERAESARFTGAQHYMTRIEILTWWWSRILEIAWSILIPAASAAVLIYGGSRVVRGTLTIGDVMMFSTYLLMLLGPLETLTSTASTIQSNLAALDRVLDLLGEETEFAGAGGGVPARREDFRGAFELRDVWFTYPKASARPGRGPAIAEPPREPEPALRGVALRVAPGQTVALVGPSGSGKTTLCNLVARFYDPSSGAILLDGRDLREYDVASYRALLGIVEQDVFLFDGTVAQNIAYGRRGATREELRAAANAANADEFIVSLEKGYDTVIGERGVRLSGGQKQRLAIARALLADPRILILDEATSNLDSESEGLIQRSLATLLRGRTCFVIAHRLSTIRHAHRIVVLDHGRVIESGTHEELIAAGGRYAELLRIQVEGHAFSDAAATRTPGAASA